MFNKGFKLDDGRKALFILLVIAALIGVLFAYTPWQGKIILATVVGFVVWKLWNYIFKS